MANVFRGPLYVNRREVPPALIEITDTSRGRFTGLFPAGKPLVAMLLLAAPSTLYQPLNTSQGTPLTLRAPVVVQAPLNTPVALSAPERRYQNLDTTRGTPKTLYGDQIPPRVNPPQFLVDPVRPVYDTSKSSYGTFYPQAATQPAGKASFVALPRLLWQPEDTSAGTPQGFRPDQIPPVTNEPQFMVDPVRPVTDTSKGSYGTFYPFVVQTLPAGQASFVALPRLLWQPLDTSASRPKPTIPDATTPTFNAPQFQVDRIRPVVDTSQSAYGTTHPLAAPPIGGENFVSLPRLLWQPQDSSTGSAPLYKGQVFRAPVGRLILQGVATPVFAQGNVLKAPTGRLILSGIAASFVQSTPVAHVIDYRFYQLTPFRQWTEMAPYRPWTELIPKRNWTVLNYPPGVSPMAIGPKDPSETVVATIDYQLELAGETISSVQSITAVTVKGTDPSPSAILSGGATISGTTIQQTIIGGLNDATYEIQALINTSGGRRLMGVALLPIVVA